ncbi:unnamed protein product, partial [Oppiella nova]
MSPALLDFTCIINADINTVTHYYTLFAIGTIIGSLCIGAGVIDIVQTVWLIEMWDSKSGSLLQLSEFGYGLGITIGPLIVEPFLVGDGNCMNDTSAVNTTINYSHKLLPPFLATGSLQILGAIMMLIMYLCHKYIPNTQSQDNQTGGHEVERPTEQTYRRRYTVQFTDENIQQLKQVQLNTSGSYRRRFSTFPVVDPSYVGSSGTYRLLVIGRRFSTFPVVDPSYVGSSGTYRLLVIGLGAVCFATIINCESAYIDYSPTFFRYYSNVQGYKTAILLFVMTSSYTLTRACSIYVAYRVRPQYILSVHYVIVFTSLVLLSFANHNTILMWTGNVLFGIGIATFWSATFSYIETYFEVTDRIGTIYVSLLGLLEIITQFIEGPFLE